MRAARVFASPSTREGFGITFAEAMVADCTVIAAAHPDSAADEVIAEAGYLVDPTTNQLTDALDQALTGDRPPTAPMDRASRYDWESVAKQAATVYERAIDGTWASPL